MSRTVSTWKDKVRKRAQRAKSLKGKKCANCGSKKNLQRHHEKGLTSNKTRILCQKCQKNLHVRNGTWGNPNKK